LFVVEQTDVNSDSDVPAAHLTIFKHVYDELSLQTLQSGRIAA